MEDASFIQLFIQLSLPDLKNLKCFALRSILYPILRKNSLYSLKILKDRSLHLFFWQFSIKVCVLGMKCFKYRLSAVSISYSLMNGYVPHSELNPALSADTEQ